MERVRKLLQAAGDGTLSPQDLPYLRGAFAAQSKEYQELLHPLGAPQRRRQSAPDRKDPAHMPDSVPVVADPFARFQEWMQEAWAHEPDDANAMTLATTTPAGAPSSPTRCAWMRASFW